MGVLLTHHGLIRPGRLGLIRPGRLGLIRPGRLGLIGQRVPAALTDARHALLTATATAACPQPPS